MSTSAFFFPLALCLCFLLLLCSFSLFLRCCWQKSETEWGPQALVQNQQTRELILESRHDFQRKLWRNNKLIECVSLPTRSCIELPQLVLLDMSSQLGLPKPMSYPWCCHILIIILYCQECPNSLLKRFQIVRPDSSSRPLNALVHHNSWLSCIDFQ